MMKANERTFVLVAVVLPILLVVVVATLFQLLAPAGV